MLRTRHVVVFAGAIAACVTAIGCRAQREGQIIDGANSHHAAAAIARYGCGSCHTIPGIRGADGTVAPSLARFSQRGVIAGQLPFTPENLVQWIMHPQQEQPGVAMPEMGVNQQDAKDIAEYLLHLGT